MRSCTNCTTRKVRKVSWPSKLILQKPLIGLNGICLFLFLLILVFVKFSLTGFYQCISTTSFSFLINGSSFDLFNPLRGLGQGDPLSHFLFILYTEFLLESFMLRNLQVIWLVLKSQELLMLFLPYSMLMTFLFSPKLLTLMQPALRIVVISFLFGLTSTPIPANLLFTLVIILFAD